MVDSATGDFAQGGLARLTPDPAVRLLIVPADPEKHVVEFDSDFWAWWTLEPDDPAGGGSVHWGPGKLPTVSAAVTGTQAQADAWWRYLAIHRNGALEMGLGDDGAWERDDDRYFPLTTIVGRCWAALSRYAEVVERFALDGPWEVTLGLRATHDAQLANFGEGWAEPGFGLGSASRCAEPNLLMRRELAAWPAGTDEVRQLVFSFGAQIEDAWGVEQRRFLAHRGERAGAFDTAAYSWR